ncbi:MAG: CRISPR-associated protein Cas4 [Brooklawnia sp.]|uniref:CRISPR-associated protein Cas4 n=1 Tax=Brooklawnia sp. TaxID=2699740 RepID=UPI003C7186FB
MADYMALSIVEHHAYCPRQAALIHVEGLWAASADTARGEADHAAVDRAVRSESRAGVVTWSSLPVWSDRLQLTGVCDAVELVEGVPVPIEYKPRHSFRLKAPAAQQLAAQALCLEEMWGCEVVTGVLYTRADRRRHEIPIDAALRAVTEETIRACHALIQDRLLPPVVADRRRCDRCSLAEVCGVELPDPTNSALFVPQPEGAW